METIEYGAPWKTNLFVMTVSVLFVPEIFLVFAAGFSFSAAIGTWEVSEIGNLQSRLSTFHFNVADSIAISTFHRAWRL